MGSAGVRAGLSTEYSRLDEAADSSVKGQPARGGKYGCHSWKVLISCLAFLFIALALLFFSDESEAEIVVPAKCVFNLFLARHCDKNPPWAKAGQRTMGHVDVITLNHKFTGQSCIDGCTQEGYI
eukprot:symbB.v1.2.016402.t1/scaffold1217.1/size131114/3